MFMFVNLNFELIDFVTNALEKILQNIVNYKKRENYIC